MQMAGPPLTVTGGHLHFLGEETDGVTDMVRQTRLRQKRGCDAVKLIVTGGQMTPGSVAERVSMTTEEIRADFRALPDYRGLCALHGRRRGLH